MGLLGTNVRPDQVEQLRAFSRAYLVLDTDDAGVEGTLHLQEAIGATAVAVALPEDVKDPAELALRPGGHLSRASTLAAGAMSTSVHATATFGVLRNEHEHAYARGRPGRCRNACNYWADPARP